MNSSKPRDNTSESFFQKSNSTELLKTGLIIFSISLLIKLIFLLYAGGNPFVLSPTNDEIQHIQTARDILNHGPIQKEAFYFAPLYPYLLACFIALFGEQFFTFRLLQVIAGALNIIAVFFLAGIITGKKRTAFTAAGISLLYGGYYLYEVLLLKTTFAILISNLALLFLFIAINKSKGKLWLLSGFLMGAAVLLRGNVIVLIFFILAGLMFEAYKKRIVIRFTVIWISGILLGILPATVHNAIASGDFVPTTYQGGANLYIGNHSGASGKYQAFRSGRQTSGDEKYDVRSLAELETGKKLSPSEVSWFWTKRSLSYIFHNPGQWIILMLKKFVMFHSNAEFEDTIDFNVFRSLSPLLWFSFIPIGLIFGLAISGMILSYKKIKEYRLLYLLTAGSAASVILFFIFSRYRIPALTLYILFASIAVEQILDFARNKNRKALLKWCAIALAYFIISLFIIKPSSRAATYNNLGTKYADMGDFKKALSYFNQAVSKSNSPDSISNYNYNIARTYAKMGDYCSAAKNMEHTLRYLKAEEIRNRDPVFQEDIIHVSKEQAAYLEKCGKKDEAEKLKDDVQKRYMNLLKEENLPENTKMDKFREGMYYAEMEQHEKALNYFNEALKEKPGDPEIYIKMGLSLVKLKRVDQALQAFQKALTLDPSNPLAYKLAGNIFYMQGNLKMAVKLWEKSLELDPSDSSLRKNINILSKKTGK